MTYASLNPIRLKDVDGNLSIDVVFPKNRASVGVLTIKDDFGNAVGSFYALGRGSSRNQMVANGDTPTGAYNVGAVVDTSKWNQDSYGEVAVRISPSSGKAKDSGRSGLLIHGGREANSGSKWDKNYRKAWPLRKDLRATHGCIRVSNEDVKEISNILSSEREKRDSLGYKARELFNGLIGNEVEKEESLSVRDMSINERVDLQDPKIIELPVFKKLEE